MDSNNRQIYRKSSGYQGRRVSSDDIPEEEAVSPRIYSRNSAKREFESYFAEEFGEEINIDEMEREFSQIEEMEAIVNSKVKEPSFPFFTFYIALCIDILGIADFTGVGWFVMTIIEIIFGVILFFLMWRKLNTMFRFGSKMVFGRGKRSFAQKNIKKVMLKNLKKYMSRRLLAIIVIKVIPVLGIFASEAFFVYLAHNRQKKFARQYIHFVGLVGNILKKYYRKNT